MNGVIKEKGDIGELRKALIVAKSSGNADRREALRRVISFMSMGLPVSTLFPEVIMLCNTTDVIQKKMTYFFISTYAHEHTELALLVVNTFQNDCSSNNPTIRGLALRYVSSLVLPNIVEYVVPLIKSGVEDKSSYVRKIAVISILKLHGVMKKESISDKILLSEGGMVEKLYSMLKDSDPNVIINAINVLEEILKHEGGMAVSKKMLNYLLSRITEFDEWGTSRIISLLNKVKCENEDEVFDLLNLLDEYLMRFNTTLLLSTTDAFLRLTADMPKIRAQVYERVLPPLVTAAANGDTASSYVILKHIKLIAYNAKELLAEEFVNFFLHYGDEIFNKMVKLDILAIIANDENVVDIVDEISAYIYEYQEETMLRKLVDTLGKIALNVPDAKKMVIVKKFLDFIELEMMEVLNFIFPIFEKILRSLDEASTDYATLVVPAMQRSAALVKDDAAVSSLVWVMGEYGEKIWESPYILESYVEKWPQLSSRVRMRLLSAVVKLFFKRGPECKAMLVDMFRQAFDSSADFNQNCHDRALLYFRMISSDVEKTAALVASYDRAKAGTSSPGERGLEPSHPTFDRFSCALGLSDADFTNMLVKPKKEPALHVMVPPERKGTPDGKPPALPKRRDSPRRNVPPPVVRQSSEEIDFLGTVQPQKPAETGTLEPEVELIKTMLDPKRFQVLWGASKNTIKKEFQVAHGIDLTSHAAVVEILKASNVSIVANGMVKGNLKIFCYSMEKSNGKQFLCELMVNSASRAVRLTTKREGDESLDPVCNYLIGILG